MKAHCWTALVLSLGLLACDSGRPAVLPIPTTPSPTPTPATQSLGLRASLFVSPFNVPSLEFNFAGQADNPIGAPRFEWLFGDGSTATGAIARHAYDRAGTFTVTLVVRDDERAASTNITINARTP